MLGMVSVYSGFCQSPSGKNDFGTIYHHVPLVVKRGSPSRNPPISASICAINMFLPTPYHYTDSQ